MNTEWICIETHGLPKDCGKYMVKDGAGNQHEDFLVKTKKGQPIWLSNHIHAPNEITVTHYKPTT